MLVQADRAFAGRAIAAWNAGERAYADWMAEVVAPLVKVHVPQGDLTGADVLAAYYHEIRGAFPDSYVSVDEVTAEGNTVMARLTFSGTNTGKLLTMPVSTGKPATFTVIDVWHILDGKVVEFWETYDRYGMLEQLGLVREQPALALA